VSAKERLKLAFISMEGSISHWFSFWRKNSKNPSFEEFSMVLNRRFGGKERSFVFEKLAKIKQNGRVDEYIQDFELLVSQAPQTGDEQLLGYFFTGLQSKIRNQIRPHDPKEKSVNEEKKTRDVEECSAMKSHTLCSEEKTKNEGRFAREAEMMRAEGMHQ